MKDFFLEEDGTLTPAEEGWKPSFSTRVQDWFWFHPWRCLFGHWHRWTVAPSGWQRGCERCGFMETILQETYDGTGPLVEKPKRAV